ncbi:thermonuclease family protein [Cytobacillus oceanisediminis]|uniref:thermonuclease family protein n=1 Tax=Cytobacillus oceanisediminis TaxID=665099 RepID=UPI0020B355B7|nr:thermonuclease family protein [Cytobacillus oceanisediminis]
MGIWRWILSIVAILLTLLMTIITPVAWIGVLIVLFGIYQISQKRKGKMTFSKPGWFVAIGIIFSFVISLILVEPTESNTKEVAKQEDKIASEQVNKEKEEAKKLSEDKAKKEAAEKAKKEEAEKAKKEAEKLAAEQKAKEEKAKQEAIKKKEQAATNLGLVAATVSRVVDGDTIELSDGSKVRLVGVNTPESTTKTEEFGKEASDYTASKLEGKNVWLQKDVSDSDRYGRLLRFVWLDIPTDDMNESEIRSKMFNADLVLNGYAEPSTYTPDVKYSEYFVKYAREARENSTGLWAFGENGTTKGDLDPKEVASNNTPAPKAETKSAPTNSPEPKGSCNIKGNQSGIYHVPGGTYYDRTNAEVMFCSIEEAEAAGYRASKR